MSCDSGLGGRGLGCHVTQPWGEGSGNEGGDCRDDRVTALAVRTGRCVCYILIRR